jgi:hypothetical protein
VKPHIRLRRHPYEEPYHLRLVINASNGHTAGELEFYTSPDELRAWADHLAVFPQHRDDVFLAEIGSERPEDRFAYYFRFRAFTVGSRCALHFRFCNNRELPDRELSEFCILAEAAQVNVLGRLLRVFSEFQHELLVWDLENAELYQSHLEWDDD